MRRDHLKPPSKLVSAAQALTVAVLRAQLGLRLTVRAAWTFFGSDSFIITALLLAGIGMGIAGVHVVFGPGWALISGSSFCIALALLIARGNHG